MKRLRNGFTLAEVLTTLIIVGVVATIVIPMVAKNIQKQQAGPILGRAVEQIEVGNQNIIQLANDSSTDPSYSLTLSTVSLDNNGNVVLDDDFKNKVIPYWGLKSTAIDSEDIITPIDNAGGNDNTANAAMKGEDSLCYDFTKFPASACISGDFNGQTTTVLDIETGFTIYIDTNGAAKNPNRVGVDIFAFDLLNNGHLKPAASGSAGEFAKRVVEAGFRIDY